MGRKQTRLTMRNSAIQGSIIRILSYNAPKVYSMVCQHNLSKHCVQHVVMNVQRRVNLQIDLISRILDPYRSQRLYYN